LVVVEQGFHHQEVMEVVMETLQYFQLSHQQQVEDQLAPMETLEVLVVEHKVED
jgi:hypothetical protein